VLATVAFIRYLDLEVSLVVVAALLTVLGYSLNDTIVIFDRVREERRFRPRATPGDVLNRSINETLPRTILTGGTTLATALVLSFFAGEIIKPFALVMTFGIVVGTFSSVFVAAPVLLWITAMERQTTDLGMNGVKRVVKSVVKNDVKKDVRKRATRGAHSSQPRAGLFTVASRCPSRPERAKRRRETHQQVVKYGVKEDAKKGVRQRGCSCAPATERARPTITAWFRRACPSR
jgi:predicted RND superfamily exporter protein